MKKVINLSLVLLWVFIGILVLAPQVFAEGENNVTLNLLVYSDENTIETNINFTKPFGSIAEVDFRGINLSGKDFAFYIHNGKMYKNDQANFMFSDSTYVVAVFKNPNQKVAAFVDTNGQLLDIQYSSDVDFVPKLLNHPSKSGMEFKGWTIEDSVIDEDTIIKPIYSTVKSVNLSVYDSRDHENNDVLNENISGVVEYNSLVTVSTDLEGFTYWHDEKGFIMSYEKEFTFTALTDIIVTAKTDSHFDSQELNVPHVYLRDVTGINSEMESFLAKLYIPNDYTLVDYGFVVSNDNHEPDLNNNEKVHYNKSMQPNTKEFLTSISTEYAFVRAFATFEKDGNLGTVYSLVRNNILLTFEIKLFKRNNNHYPSEIEGEKTIQFLNISNKWQPLFMDSKGYGEEDGSWFEKFQIDYNLIFIGPNFAIEFYYRLRAPRNYGEYNWDFGPFNVTYENDPDYRYMDILDNNNTFMVTIYSDNGSVQFAHYKNT